MKAAYRVEEQPFAEETLDKIVHEATKEKKVTKRKSQLVVEDESDGILTKLAKDMK